MNACDEKSERCIDTKEELGRTLSGTCAPNLRFGCTRKQQRIRFSASPLTAMEQRSSQSGQFHHYLPRFVVRRWLQGVKVVTSPGRKYKGGRNKGRQRPREYKQELINTYDIKTSTLSMGTTDLGRTFGIVDMYKDDADLTDVYRVEKAFSKLESDAARIFHALDVAEKGGRSSVELVRSELNTLRKFLFLLHYRNGRHAQQFIDGRFDPESAAMVEQYRLAHGLANARAVWLRNIALLLEDEHWEVVTDERLLWTARMDYKLDALDKQLGIYRAPPGTEFVLTENGLGLIEGARTPMSFMVDLMSPGAPGVSFITLTQAFPISSKLVIFLRCSKMSQETAMIQAGVPAEEARRWAYDGLSNTSYFDDIPRTAPRTTYIPPLPADSYAWMKPPDQMTAEDWQKKEDFRMRGMVNGVPLGSRVRDRFVFAIDDLTENQAQRVNALLLTHCCEMISFLTPSCLVRAIDAFEKETRLTIFGKRRYASLRAKLVALELPAEEVQSSPTSASPSISTSPEAQSSLPRGPIHGPSGSQTASQIVPVGKSLPGLRGAFNRRAHTVPIPRIPDDSLGEPVPESSAISPVGQDSAHETFPEASSTSPLPVDDTQLVPVDIVELLSEHCLPTDPAGRVGHASASGDAPMTKSAMLVPSELLLVTEQSVKLENALPRLRGAFKSKPTVVLACSDTVMVAPQGADTTEPVPTNIAPASEPLVNANSTRVAPPSEATMFPTFDISSETESVAVVYNAANNASVVSVEDHSLETETSLEMSMTIHTDSDSERELDLPGALLRRIPDVEDRFIRGSGSQDGGESESGYSRGRRGADTQGSPSLSRRIIQVVAVAAIGLFLGHKWVKPNGW
ncbi:uncharacterized protein C8Q71DRAFT_776918 [Rhodofomes roseus]|uniref:Uncharacterized protein n=1 Tax=Rhodofomes roseus TaxID=34475 RepID=A0ABQ8K630_9APHY|nr:uncharacterized protein C8Q71DRAFT_776918 [Rhodofomes roseus]KAH9832538.1 hypothetical protein C8Q71DRAFT_776918 [Rhodofomes roseus]